MWYNNTQAGGRLRTRTFLLHLLLHDRVFAANLAPLQITQLCRLGGEGSCNLLKKRESFIADRFLITSVCACASLCMIEIALLSGAALTEIVSLFCSLLHVCVSDVKHF